MPVRIYALAKELNIDGKDLVAICERAGITGKGSALASLDDEEVDKVKGYLSSSPAKTLDNDLDPLQRPNQQESHSIKTVVTRSAAPLKGLGKKLDNEPVGTDESSGADQTTASAATDDQTDATPLQRDDSLSQTNREIKVFSKEPSKGDDAATKPPKEKRVRKPVLHLANMPQLQQPAPQAEKDQVKAQKPERRLSEEALQNREGNKQAPLKHLTSKDAKTPATNPLATPSDPDREDRKQKRGKKAPRAGKWVGEKEDNLAGMASARADRKKTQRRAKTDRATDSDSTRPHRRRRTLLRTGRNTAKPRKTDLFLELPCTVRSFSEASGIPSSTVQAALLQMGVMVTINVQIDSDLVDVLAAELGVEIKFKQPVTLEESLIDQLTQQEDDAASLITRPPVVTFLGHVDHGKTTLLDAFIGTDVVSGEAGGITQHIRAYQIDKDGRLITFVDTPGHEAFTEMRARGANVTDIAVLVIAADDGIMPQTEEAISHLKAAEVPIVVALNKIDLPGVDPIQTMTQLAQFDLTPSGDWGGDTEVIQTSALKREGLDDLLETLLTIADLHEYRANPDRPALGICLESEQESARGALAKLIVKSGTLRVGDVLVCGTTFGRVKAMYDTLNPNQLVTEAGPSVPVNVAGLDAAPDAGDAFHVLEDVADARAIAEQRLTQNRTLALSGQTVRISFEDFQQQLESGVLGQANDVAMLNLIIRADVRGSIEAIQKELSKLEHPEVQVKILQASVGGITAADVALAHASSAVIIGFNVVPDEAARLLSDERQVEIRRYNIIYKITDDIKLMLEGKLRPEERVVELGHALVQRVFPISRIGTIAGCYVAQGQIQRGCRIRVNRDGRTIGDYLLDSLRREKDDVKEVTRGLECGIKLTGFNDIKQDDVLEAYRIEEVARTL
ncbi:MAG TPA: translation initiation factor IF-2 [Planctomycetes bacterium]|nr:translation initiation factor IF-2 [Planctomycetaceae bacterium]HIN95695.1 translation initiation factor IF-2 [Planctomycetota bacterium]